MGSGMVTGLTGSEGEESSCSRMEAGVENRWSKIREILFCRVFHLILCLCHVLTIHRRCPANRRQWADFLVSLRAPLHRQYKTARTETRWHLLLKAWQMPTQTSALRGYVLFISDVRNTQKSLNCLSACGHTRGVLKTWKNTDYRRCKKRQG